jgi:ubiquinone/menaquinone biosynthesis C-methylase UbiE
VERVFDQQEPELMDRPQPVSNELRSTLRQLEFLNRYFGGHGLMRRFLNRWYSRGSHARVLDLATGRGDYPRVIAAWGRKHGVRMQIEGVDASPSILRIASKTSANYPEINYSVGDALTFEREHQYDLVHCSLALHHFSEEDAVALLRRCRELSRKHVLVVDLERSWFTSLAVRTANVLLRHGRMTCEDGDTSARRAFSYAEAAELARRAGWKGFGHRRFLFCRQALWLEI